MTPETQTSRYQSGGAAVIALNAAARDERGVIVIKSVSRDKFQLADLITGQNRAGQVITLNPDSLASPPTLAGPGHQFQWRRSARQIESGRIIKQTQRPQISVCLWATPM